MTRTLADMTPAQRADCVGRWAERKQRLMVITAVSESARTADSCYPATASSGWDDWAELAPRFDLRRAWTAEGEPEPLPEPDRDGRWWPTAASIGSVTISPAGEVVLHSGRFRDMTLHLTPAKARDLANILNAAAARATQEG